MTAIKIAAAVYLAHWIIGFERGVMPALQTRYPKLALLYSWLSLGISAAVVLA